MRYITRWRLTKWEISNEEEEEKKRLSTMSKCASFLSLAKEMLESNTTLEQKTDPPYPYSLFLFVETSSIKTRSVPRCPNARTIGAHVQLTIIVVGHKAKLVSILLIKLLNYFIFIFNSVFQIRTDISWIRGLWNKMTEIDARWKHEGMIKTNSRVKIYK